MLLTAFIVTDKYAGNQVVGYVDGQKMNSWLFVAEQSEEQQLKNGNVGWRCKNKNKTQSNKGTKK